MIIEVIKLLVPLWSSNILVNIFYFQQKNHFPDYPLDGNRLWFDGNRILGSGKNILGFPVAIIGGILGAIFVHTRTGFLSGLAVFLGAIASGFLKRRLGLKRGEPLWVIDQADYLFSAYLLFSLYGKTINVVVFLVALGITIPVHFLTNIIAYRLKIRKTYW